MDTHATTILAVKKGGHVAMAGDGQVTLGQTMIMKHTAQKVRRLYEGRILAGFAGATADAFTLFELFETKLKEVRGNLLRAVSHDIRTPLTSIVGGVSTLLDSGDQLDEATRTQLLENIRDESNWLVSVVENLLSVTRMTGEQTKIKKEMEAGEEVLSAAAMKIKKHYPEITVSVRAPQELLMIPMDVILIEQVLINLMENSIQHGGTTTRV